MPFKRKITTPEAPKRTTRNIPRKRKRLARDEAKLRKGRRLN